MKIRSVRVCRAPECADIPPHEDDEGLRLLGVPCWLIAFLIVIGLGVALLAYTASVR
ncbi:hypothetical protein [Streptomyces armeniacus]|uniref:hypothetical protein n=1 Tax=Streptomyces armeniacus TaxID=83291 RepID=UPI001AD84216|nr:hypothetical protein [Streptomyces armeniacus]